MAASYSPYYHPENGPMMSNRFDTGVNAQYGSDGSVLGSAGGFEDMGYGGSDYMDSKRDNETSYNPVEHAPAVNGLVSLGSGGMVQVDGSWELVVTVEDHLNEVKIRVQGDHHIGFVMHKIAEAVRIKQSWADHAIWWADRNMWLLHHRTTLDQYGVQSDAHLVFRRMHGNVQIVLPSLSVVTLRLDFSANVFSVVRSICRQLNIRHPEELSLTFPVRSSDLKKNNPLPIIRHGTKKCLPLVSIGAARADMPTAQIYQNSVDTLPRGGGLTSVNAESRLCLDGGRNGYGTLGPTGSQSLLRLQSDNSLDREQLDLFRYADCLQRRPAKAIFGSEWLLKPINLVQKARLNCGWLDSSRSLMEHGIEPLNQLQQSEGVNPPTLYLAFKFYDFYDLNVKYDAIRIHQLYEQARWSLLSGRFDCTEAEMIVFAALQLQAELKSAEAAANGYPTLKLGSTAAVGITNYGTLGGAPLSPDLTSSRRQLPNLMSSYNSGSMMQLQTPQTPRSMLSIQDITGSSGHPTMSRMNSLGIGLGSGVSGSRAGGGLDDLDEMMNELEQSCGVKPESHHVPPSLRGDMGVSMRTAGNPLNGLSSNYDTAVIPSLEDNLRVCRDKSMLGIRRYKEMWLIVREGNLLIHKSQEDSRQPNTQPISTFILKDCIIAPDVDVSASKFIIKLSLAVPTRSHSVAATAGVYGGRPTLTALNGSQPNGLNLSNVGSPSPGTISRGSPTGSGRTELWIRYESVEQYSKWAAAFQLGSRGKTLASKAAYEKEIDAITENLRLQKPGHSAAAISAAEASNHLTDLCDFCAEKIVKKVKSKETLRRRIFEALGNMNNLTLMEAKMRYIKTWQKLTNFGRTYFIVFFDKNQTTLAANLVDGVYGEQILAIYQGRVELVSSTGEVQRAWNFSDMRSWNVNWDAGRVVLEFRNGQITFRPLNVNCKTIVEFIGGYVFLSQRTPEKNQELNERMFHKLTGVID